MMTNELMTAIESLDPATVEALAAGIVAIYIAIVASIVFAALRYLMKAIGFCTMYRKTGIAPWKAFIPFYNIYTNYKISWNGKLFFLYAVLTIVSSILVFAEGALALVGTVASLGVIYMAVKQNLNMAKLFGKGIGTGIALVFFPGITSLILGLGKAEYTAITK